MEGRYRRLLWSLLLVGLAVRLLMAAVHAESFDLMNFRESVEALGDDGFDFYGSLNAGPVAGFPYPPGYLPWLVLAETAGSGFAFAVRLAPITADIALAWLVQRSLRADGAQQRTALCAAGLIVFGPQVFVTSAVEGQFDSVAILPAVVAVLLWRSDGPRRAIAAGLLIGLGAALKTVPLLLVAALLPTARSRSEGVRLIAVALAVPLTSLAPFIVADPAGVLATLRYHGYPGGGGLNIVLQPGLADYSTERLGTTVEVLQHLNAPMVLVMTGALTWLLWRRRVEPIRAAAILWLGLFVAGVNWYPQYLNWGLPFFLMTGWVTWVALMEVALLPFACDTSPGSSRC